MLFPCSSAPAGRKKIGDPGMGIADGGLCGNGRRYTGIMPECAAQGSAGFPRGVTVSGTLAAGPQEIRIIRSRSGVSSIILYDTITPS